MDGTQLKEMLETLSNRQYYSSARIRAGLARDEKGVRFIGGHATLTDDDTDKTRSLDYGTMILVGFSLSALEFRKWITRLVNEEKGLFGDFDVAMKGQFEFRGDLSQQFIPSNYQNFPMSWECNIFRYHLDNTATVQPSSFLPAKHDLPLYPDSRTAFADWLGYQPDRFDYNGTLVTFLPNLEARLGAVIVGRNRVQISIFPGRKATTELKGKIFIQEAFEAMGKPQRSTNRDLQFSESMTEVEVDFKPGLVYLLLLNKENDVVDYQRFFSTWPGHQGQEFEVTAESIERIVQQGESETLEFKLEVGKNHRELVETMVAFANSRGGAILLGVDDDGEIKGIPDSELQKIEEKITNITREFCDPTVQFKTTRLLIQERNIVVVEVPEGSAKPHWLKNRGPMTRSGSTDRVMSRFEAEQAFRKPGSGPFG